MSGTMPEKSARDETGLPAIDAERLRQEIEQTRENLGATVEQLVAKADVKSRAQAKAAELAEQAKSAVAQAREQAAARAGSARGALAAKTADARRKAAGARHAAPGPVRQTAARGAVMARQYWAPLSAAAAAGLLAATAFIIWQRGRQ